MTGLWVENSLGQVLLVQRAFTKKNEPGKWGPAVSGTVEKGETYDSNIMKESREEIGLINCEFKKVEKLRIFGQHNFFVQWYFAKVDKRLEDFVLEDGSSECLKWFERKELKSALENTPEDFTAGFKVNLTLLRNFLKE